MPVGEAPRLDVTAGGVPVDIPDAAKDGPKGLGRKLEAMAGKQLSSDIKAFGCDRKHSGAADNKALLKALARLISHRVPLATAALYPQLARPDKRSDVRK